MPDDHISSAANILRWELPNGDSSAERPALGSLPAELGWSRVDVHHARTGITLFETWLHAKAPLTLLADGSWREPCLVLSMQLAGTVQVHHPAIAPHLAVPETWSFFRLTGDETPSRFENRPGQTSEVVALTVTAERLRAMLDGQRAPAPIQELLEGRFDPSAGEIAMSPGLRRILQQIRDTPYRGAMAGLYAEGKIHELLAEALTGIEGQADFAGRVLSRERRAALAARDRLLADLANPPSIEELARECGLSQRRMNALFLELFGATPFQCLTLWRLDQARALLAEGTLAIKQVAHLMGYAHVSSFTHAYTRRFGTPPTGRRGGGFS